MLSAGSPDPSFGFGDGWSSVDVGGGTFDTPFDVEVTADGKIIVVGDAAASDAGNSASDLFVLRFDQFGALDPTFAGGKVVMNLATVDGARAAAVQDDGKVLVAGFSRAEAGAAHDDFLLIRLNETGEPDPTFGNLGNGRVFTDFTPAGASTPTSDQAYAILLLPDDRIIVAGTNGSNFVFARYTSTGQLDTTFGTNGTGKIITDVSNVGTNEKIDRIVLTPDGDLLAGGAYYSSQQGSGYRFGMAQYSYDGVLDTSFGAGGVVNTNYFGQNTAVAVQDDGRIVAMVANDFSGWYTLLRFSEFGEPDLSFDSDGAWQAPTIGTHTFDVRDVAITDDGKIVVPGQLRNDVAVARHHPDGHPDPLFDYNFSGIPTPPSGTSTIHVGGSPETGRALAILDDGRIVVAAKTTPFSESTQQNIAVLRIDGQSAANTPPIPDTGGPYHLREGASVRLDATGSTDPDGRIRLYQWDFDYDGTSFDVDATGELPLMSSEGIDGPSTRTIALRVTDSQDAVVLATTTVNILNVPPTLVASGPSRIVPGQPYVLTLGKSDLGPDTVSTWHVNWGDGSPIQDVPGSATSATHVYSNANQPRSIQVSATDEDGTHAANFSALDPTFSGDGILPVDLSRRQAAVSSIVDPITGKLYVLADYKFSVYRYHPNGTLDTTWGVNGVADYNYTNSHFVHSMFMQPNGKLIVAGTTGNDFTLIRYNTLGQRDSTFGIDGIVRNNLGQNGNNHVQAMVVQPDGKFVLGGYTDKPSSGYYGMARYSANGELDPTFGTGGMIVGRISTVYNNYILSLAVQTDGKLVAAISSGVNMTVARFNADGSLDTSFNGGLGYRSIQFDGYSEAASVLVQPDGRIVVAGRADGPGGNRNFALARLHPDGSLDPTFGPSGDGRAMFDFVSDEEFISEIILAPDGGILAGGRTLLYPETSGAKFAFVIAKLTPDGQLDTEFAGGGVIVREMTPGSDILNDLMLAGDKLYAVGSAGGFGSPSYDLVISRFNYGPVAARANDAPVLANPAFSATALDEGSTLTLTGTLSDPDTTDGHLIAIDWGDGSLPEILRLAPGVFNYSAQHVFVDDNPTATSADDYVVRITAEDGLDTHVIQRTVTVRNAVPAADLGTDRNLNEGDVALFSPTRVDPGAADTFTYAWKITNAGGTTLATGSNTTFSYTPRDENTYTVQLTLTDDDGGVWVDTARLLVANVAPSFSLPNDRTVIEGSTQSVTATVVDPGQDTLTRTWTVFRPNNTVLLTGSSASISFTPPDEGIYRVRLRVSDGDGGVTTDEMLVMAINQAPSLAFIGANGVFAGESYSVSLERIDLATDVVTQWTINWGDGSPVQTITGGSLGPVSHTYTAVANNITLTGTLTDEDGTYTIPIKTIDVGQRPVLANGILTVWGTEEDDVIGLSHPSSIDKVSVGVNGAGAEFDIASVSRINVFMFGGDDELTLHHEVPASVIDMGDGDDQAIFTSGGSHYNPATVFGGNGNDVVTVTPTAVHNVTFDGGANTDRVVYQLRHNSASAYVGNTWIGDTLKVYDTNIEEIFIQGGTSVDTITVTPRPGVIITVVGGNSPTSPGDNLFLALAGVTDPVHTVTGAKSGTYTFSNRAPVIYSGVASVSTDAIAPAVTEVSINASGAPQRSNPTTIALKFSEPTNVGYLIANIRIENIIKMYELSSPDQPLAWLDHNRMSWNSSSRTLTIDLTVDGFGGSSTSILTDGRYQLAMDTAFVLDAGGNAVADTDGTPDGMLIIDRETHSATPDFIRFAGDLDGDGDVDLNDLSTLAAHYGSVSPLGDVDGDGDVDLSDLSMLSSKYGTSLPPLQGGTAQVAVAIPTEPAAPTPPKPPAITTFAHQFRATSRNLKFQGPLLSFNRDQFNASRTWKAKIDWGDGTTSTANVTYNAKYGRWMVLGNHQYRKTGDYVVSIAIK